MVTVTGHSPGSRKQLFDSFSLSLPSLQVTEDIVSLRDLITRIVMTQVDAFTERQHDNRFIRVLTQKAIIAGVTAGKISSGGSQVPVQPVNIDEAVANALEAFEDGLYLVAIDSRQYEKLNEPIDLNADSRVSFIRLTLIVGG